EGADVRRVAENRIRAFGEVEALDETSGKFGVAQRTAKISLQTAPQAPAAIASKSISGEAGDRLTASGGGYFGGNVLYFDAKKDTHAVAVNCRQIGRKTFFQRGDRLVDST